MGELSFLLSIRNFDNENSRRLPNVWTELFAQNNLNGLYGTKIVENETERFADRTKRFENKTKRFGNGTKNFENGTFLRCSSVLQGLYFIIISPWEKGVPLHLNKFESSSPKNALCHVWLKLSQYLLLEVLCLLWLYLYNLVVEWSGASLPLFCSSLMDSCPLSMWTRLK